MAVDGIVGLQRGDEGKGRFTDMWAAEYDVIARYNGGPNAGHTVVTPEDLRLKLNTLPSAAAYPDKMSVIGDGVFIDAIKLWDEIEYVRDNGLEVSPKNLLISSSAHLILPHHIVLDEKREAGSKGQGSTKSGIAQVDADFALRQGLRAEVINNRLTDVYDAVLEGLIRNGPLWNQILARIGLDYGRQSDKKLAATYVDRAKRLGDFVTDTMLYLNNELDKGKSILAEGAQAFLLDKYQGMYPHTTSSITTSGGISPGLGVSPQSIGKVLGVAKAVPSHVGGGHFVTEVHDEHLQAQLHGDLSAPDAEFGTRTGRKRRLGHLDIPLIRRANKANGTTEMALTKLDWLSRYDDEIPVCVSYTRKGNNLKVAPNAEYKLQQSEPNYEYLPAWDEDISDVRRFEDLPGAAQDYVKFIQDKAGVRISMIGVGQGREEVIVMAV